MILIADEARDKVCIYQLNSFISPHAMNVDVFDSIMSMSGCLSSDCMAWVWVDEEKEIGRCGLLNEQHNPLIIFDSNHNIKEII